MPKFITFLLLVTLFSCSDVHRPKQLEKINALKSSLDSMEQVYLATKIDTIAGLSLAINSVELRIKQNFIQDTVNLEMATKMDGYKMAKKSLKPFSKNMVTIKNGIEEERLSLSLLYSDVENGNGKRAEFDDYIEFEKNKVEQIRILLEEFTAQKKLIDDNFSKYHEELETFSFELLEKK